MPLRPPPADLTRFPLRRPGPSTRTLHRLFRRRDRSTGEVRGPWQFSHRERPRSGRFDLPLPDGTCYWSSRRYGAFVEAFRGVAVVAQEDLRARRLATAQAPDLRLADLLSPRALPFGITAAISTQPDYALPQQWAEALRGAAFEGLVGTCSHDPASKALNVAVFGEAGAPGEVAGWRTSDGPALTDPVLLSELVAYGIRIVPVPHEVQISEPTD